MVAKCIFALALATILHDVGGARDDGKSSQHLDEDEDEHHSGLAPKLQRSKTSPPGFRWGSKDDESEDDEHAGSRDDKHDKHAGSHGAGHAPHPDEHAMAAGQIAHPDEHAMAAGQIAHPDEHAMAAGEDDMTPLPKYLPEYPNSFGMASHRLRQAAPQINGYGRGLDNAALEMQQYYDILDNQMKTYQKSLEQYVVAARELMVMMKVALAQEAYATETQNAQRLFPILDADRLALQYNEVQRLSKAAEKELIPKKEGEEAHGGHAEDAHGEPASTDPGAHAEDAHAEDAHAEDAHGAGAHGGPGHHAEEPHGGSGVDEASGEAHHSAGVPSDDVLKTVDGKELKAVDDRDEDDDNAGAAPDHPHSEPGEHDVPNDLAAAHPAAP